MTASGMLQHEGSSAPQDPRRVAQQYHSDNRNALVLDIAGPAVQPNRDKIQHNNLAPVID